MLNTPIAPTQEPKQADDRLKARIPRATYRLQFSQDFTFRDAEAIVPYLHALGVSDVYGSPILKSRAGSHGYDITDHSRLNPALGSDEDFARFTSALRERGMGLIVDMVPNHMGIDDPNNVWWMDVLENGPSSAYADTFDIQWQPVKRELENRVLLPILGDQYGNVLENGQFRLAYEDGAFALYYYDHKLPLAPRTYGQVLSLALEGLTERLGADDLAVQELQSILTALGYLPPRTETDPNRLAERAREKEVVKRRLNALYTGSDAAREAIDDAVETFNGRVGDPTSFDRLDALIEAQAVRPTFWRVAAEEINYRRFFDVNDLAAIRVELPPVFDATHALVMRWLAEGQVTGLRIDHPDGLWDPPRYFQRLQERYVQHVTGKDSLDRADGDGLPLYVVAEKILSRTEPLPEDWAVHGTTGYDFLNQVNGLFVNRRARQAFDRLYAHFVQRPIDFDRLVHDSKLMIMRTSLVSEINMLSHQLDRIGECNRHYRDFTLGGLTAALREVIASLPVYRVYINALTGEVPERDRAVVEATVEAAKQRAPQTDASVFDFIRDTLLLRNLASFREQDQEPLRHWIMKFQQLSGPVMAKGVEDTAFYIYNRLASLNEVGGHPDHFGVALDVFHQQNRARARRWPHAMLTTSTHDTKRSEDVRARINVLSEMPQEWRKALTRWSRLNQRHKTEVDGELAPSRNDEYLLYQTLLGAWPLGAPSQAEFGGFRDRIVAYMRKATKEAKVHTGWLRTSEAYDAAVEAFVVGVLGDERFLADLAPLQRRVAFYGHLNSLAQTLLKLTSPGVPDIYQGTELWDLSLVDPDNRRSVDYKARVARLDALQGGEGRAGHNGSQGNGKVRPADPNLDRVRELVDCWEDGWVKLHVVRRALHVRQERERLFAEGDYLPLKVAGPRREYVCAFARRQGNATALVVTPRLVVGLTGGADQTPLGEGVWTTTHLVLPGAREGQHYRNAMTSEVLTVSVGEGGLGLPLASVLAHFPVALLTRI